MAAYQKEYREKNRARLIELQNNWKARKRRSDPDYFREKERRKYERQQRRLHGEDWQPRGNVAKLSPEELRSRVNARRRRYYRISRVKNPDRYAAKLAVKAALASGRLVRQPCFCCGVERAQAHHPDYSDPLGVVWLCREHHQQLHREFEKELVKSITVC